MNKIANGIMKLYEYKESICYRASCGCSDPKHDLSITIEQDLDECDNISIIFYTDIQVQYTYIDHGDSVIEIISNWIDNIKFRIKKAFEILFTGYTGMDAEFILDREENIKDFINALNEGLTKIKNNKKDN